MIALATAGHDDADIFVAKGNSMPTRNQYFKKSDNYKHDEILIEKADNSESDQYSVYTIGVYGVSNICTYSLLVYSQEFRLLTYSDGNYMKQLVTDTQPLFVKLRTFSFQDSFKLNYHSEGDLVDVYLIEHNLRQPLSPENLPSDKNFIKKDSTVSADLVRRFEFKNELLYNSEKKYMLGFYLKPGLPNRSAIVHAALINNFSPVELKINDKFRLVLNKGEQIVCKFTVSEGVLNALKLRVHGKASHMSITFDEK